jgi:6-pyruvoyl-tetrahydropterin synthase
MTVAVARRYTFVAEHYVEGAPEPWSKRHSHTYTVEVVAVGDPDERGMIVDTDELDRAWGEIVESLKGEVLNEVLPGCTTTVEDLAVLWLELLVQTVPISEVTVWEDVDRWGRARA